MENTEICKANRLAMKELEAQRASCCPTASRCTGGTGTQGRRIRRIRRQNLSCDGTCFITNA
jgi:hypothetical protein